MTNQTHDENPRHSEVRKYYAEAARNRSTEPVRDSRWGSSLYDSQTLEETDTGTVNLSMGCGNPHAMADLTPGEVVLDLGSGGGLDVILSAKRVAPDGKAYGLDFLTEMIEIASQNAADAGVENVEFLHGMIEAIPLPDASVDVVISNCVINLAPDKRPVFDEIARVLKPGGRIAISDVVSIDGYETPDDAEAWAECGAGALEHGVYLDMLVDAGLASPSIERTHETSPGLHAAIVRARRPAEDS